MRVGQGVDVHAFSDDPDRRLVLGGLLLPDERGLAGHSDGDVVLHAVVDALLGAAALGDIGTVFGTDEPRYAGAPSSVFVEEAVRRVATAGWSVMSVDVTIIAQRPRIGTHRTRIVDAVQTLLGVTPGTVSVKATTTDGLGAIGQGAGMACQAIALLERN
ncbi:MAG: 2-C-methyl-D-erythritol 2,4-cyclodiphosphate synthase [Actinomycetota bacterium]|jgi:2-C-methyl-D-erythritol 2,4-cyclodiphosphate synthase|nr:2-C-methyl-D-erythritol 2,4-cyclodiphosphate synthase [Actinomycetota bacterium]